MRGRAASLAAFAALASCGGHVQTDVPDTGAAPVTDASADVATETSTDAAVWLSPCHAGDPPATLVTGLSASIFGSMATDGTSLYVAQSSAPLLWRMDVRGGPATDLYGSNAANMSNGGALLPAAGGVLFNSTGHLTWVSDTGGPLKTVSATGVSMFDWSGTRGFSWVETAGVSVVSTVSLADGSVQPFLTTTMKDDVTGVYATKRFLHVVLVTATSPHAQYSDRRIDLTDGTVHDEVLLHAGNAQILAGPNVVCVLATDAQGISCLADDQAQDTYIPVVSAAAGTFTRYIDAHWLYALVWRGKAELSRFSLADGHEEVLMTDAYLAAATSFGDCVYAAMVTYEGASQTPSSAIWRFSPSQ